MILPYRGHSFMTFAKWKILPTPSLMSTAIRFWCAPSSVALQSISTKGWYTYDVYENCSIFRTPYPLVHLRPKSFHTLGLGHPISNEPPPTFQMITNQFKKSIIQGWLLYAIRSFFQVGFRFQYKLINRVWLPGFILLSVQLCKSIPKCLLFIIIHISSTHFAINLFYLHNMKT